MRRRKANQGADFVLVDVKAIGAGRGDPNKNAVGVEGDPQRPGPEPCRE
jgi:hypothetical protein